jgi:hypothetical protein
MRRGGPICEQKDHKVHFNLLYLPNIRCTSVLQKLTVHYIYTHSLLNCWVFRFCPSSHILKTRKHASETGFVSVLRCKGETTALSGSLERATPVILNVIHHHQNPLEPTYSLLLGMPPAAVKCLTSCSLQSLMPNQNDTVGQREFKAISVTGCPGEAQEQCDFNQLRVKPRLTCQQLKHEHPERPVVCADIMASVQDHFRGHILWSTTESPRLASLLRDKAAHYWTVLHKL